MTWLIGLEIFPKLIFFFDPNSNSKGGRGERDSKNQSQFKFFQVCSSIVLLSSCLRLQTDLKERRSNHVDFSFSFFSFLFFSSHKQNRKQKQKTTLGE
jgi:hypothetical protein